MGYYTSYQVTLYREIEGKLQEIGLDKEIFRQISDDIRKDDDASYALDEDLFTNDSCKWYEHDDFFICFSKQHPDIVFELYGEGEMSTDIWLKYYKNGRVQKCPASVTFDDYDPSKLK